MILSGLSLPAQSKRMAKPPALYVDQGACPFECCQYGEWTASKPAPVYAQPVAGAQSLATVTTGTKIKAITGEVRTRAGRFVVRKPMISMRTNANGEQERYKPGDVIYVYTYHGEGHFTVWFAGMMYDESLGFSPAGGGSGRRGESDREGMGELDKELESTWWVRAKLPNGQIVWLRNPSGFDGMDACS
jgi:hypothetical protein